MPTLILGEDEAQMSLGSSLSGEVAKVDGEGIPAFGSTATSFITQTFRVDGAVLLSDRWQAGLSIPVVSSRFTIIDQTDASTSLGDIKLTVGYEVLPSWTYSRWMPQGFLFSVVTLPTGRSRYNSESAMSVDATGGGFLAAQAGLMLLKRFDLFDAFIVPEIHYGFPRTFSIYDRSLVVQAGVGGSLLFGLGYSPNGGNLRIGLRVQPRADQARLAQMVGLDSSQRGWMSNCDTGIDLAYMLNANNTLMASYTDQTLLGPAFNTPLNRVIAINFQHRWER